jgi:hypothetical protein
MPQKTDGGQYSSADAINRNADELSSVEGQVATMHQDILRLRSMYMGLVELVREKVPFDQPELDAHIQKAWATISGHEPGAAKPMAQASAQAAAGRPTERMHTCRRCGNQVPASRINVLLDGELCDVCVNT